ILLHTTTPFPTRRSSDLMAESENHKIRNEITKIPDTTSHERDWIREAPKNIKLPQQLEHLPAEDAWIWEHLNHCKQMDSSFQTLDRKSTRLNSSHEWISY